MLLGDACYWSCMSIFFLSFLCQNNNNKKKSRQTTCISPIRININNTSGKTECMASPVACGLNRSHCKVCATASHAGHRGAAQSWKKKNQNQKTPITIPATKCACFGVTTTKLSIIFQLFIQVTYSPSVLSFPLRGSLGWIYQEEEKTGRAWESNGWAVFINRYIHIYIYLMNKTHTWIFLQITNVSVL